MALPSSESISANNIRTEIGKSTQTNFSIKNAETGVYVDINQASASRPNGSVPYSFGEWRGYNHSASNVVLDVTYITDTPIYYPAILSILLNGTTTESVSTSGTAQINLNVGGTFRVTVNGAGNPPQSVYIRVVSNIRGVLFDQDGIYQLQTPTYTRQSGETFQIYAEAMNNL